MPADRELMRRIVQRDASAFDTFLARHGPFVRKRLMGIVRDEVVSDDLLQEVFLRVWTRGKQWDSRGDVRGWVARIATNLALNHLRSLRRRRHQPLLGATREGDEDEENLVPGWMIDAAAVAPEAAAELTEYRERLQRMIDALPPEKQEVIRLIHEEEKGMREAAEQLGIPVGTVKSRLHYAMKWLAKRWGEMMEEE